MYAGFRGGELEVKGTQGQGQGPPRPTKRPLVEALIAYAAFCGLSVLSRLVPPLFFLVIVCGIAFPLIWGRVTRDWAAMGFTRQKLAQALYSSFLYQQGQANPLEEREIEGTWAGGFEIAGETSCVTWVTQTARWMRR
jgi:hypothetical protein